MNRIKILNTNIDNLSMHQTLQRIENNILQNIKLHHVVVNASKMVAMQMDLKFLPKTNKALKGGFD